MPEEYGLYVVTSVPASFVLLFGDWGVNAALTKFIAQYRAEGQEPNAAPILSFGLLFNIGVGLALASFTFFLADFLAGFVLQKPEAAVLIKVSCLMVLGNQLYNTCWSTFLGFEAIRYNMFIQVLFSILKVGLMLFLILFGLKTYGAVLGLSLANLVTGLIGVVIIVVALLNPVRTKQPKASVTLTQTMRMVLTYGFPFAISGIIGDLGGQFYSFLMARYASTVSIGNYGVATNLTVLVGFITFPVMNILFPTFSKMTGTEAREKLGTAFAASVKYVSYLILPVTVLVMALSQPLIAILFGEAYDLAPFFVVLASIGSLLCGVGSLSMSSLLASQGETKTILKIGLLTMGAGIPLSLILIPPFGVTGFLIQSLAVQGINTILSIYWVRKLFKFQAWIFQSVRTYLTSLMMAGLVIVVENALQLGIGIENNALLLGVGILVGLFSYLLLLPLTRAIEPTDLDKITIIFEKIVFFAPIFKKFFALMKRVEAIRLRR